MNMLVGTASPSNASSDESTTPSLTVASTDHFDSDSRPKTNRRRGHFKSRLGCFNCKRRRIKCNEIRPECSACRRLALECSYPVQNAASTDAAPTSALSILTIEDLALFHRFLTAGIPAIPLKCEHLWWEVASISHSYECLAHAMLGLGASYLSQNGESKYAVQVLKHRTVAIRLFKDLLAKMPQTPADADALFATIGCLLTQAALLPNNMVEYMTLLRIADYVVRTVTPKFPTSIFHIFTQMGHVDSLVTLVADQPRDDDVIQGFRNSIMLLEGLCQWDIEKDLLAKQVRCIDALSISPQDACAAFIVVWLTPTTFSNEEFSHFLSPDNGVGHILTIHILLLDYILGHFCIDPSHKPNFSCRKDTVISWTKSLAQTLPRSYLRYMEWALGYCEILAQQDARYLLSP
ncbi:C6 transcription factor [Pochonia chlamydosporia 170]|uniref:C6 transcription factor n=1 Tax=Pochonia chlamydosporia 170 TaxID=1380566 RepID=A0A179EZX3_METCM|nr:C6 transcription factor [Pochonia chlamydosporia 170]OAQ58702.1 C6 transcription factor [Pochonia chlamydosporia 170]